VGADADRVRAGGAGRLPRRVERLITRVGPRAGDGGGPGASISGGPFDTTARRG
jgi:hypothetical protein